MMTRKINVGIVGGSGYTGGELIRLLLNHPNIELSFVFSRSNAGIAIHRIHEDLLGETDMHFTSTINKSVDVIFLCLGHGESNKFLEENSFSTSVKIIDLSQDFRLGELGRGREFVYGLPELNRDEIKKSNNVANPGCFATAIQLGLLPMAKAGLLGDVYTTGITGSTGAGQELQSATHFSRRADNVSAYKTLTHQHLNEINRSLKQLNSNFINSIYFVPWRGNFTRGIFVSSTMTSDRPLTELINMYKEYYHGHPFIVVSDKMIHLKQIVNTNKCLVSLEKEGNKLVVHTAIDNLLKGASGQAVQNMNLIFGIEEVTGLKLKGSVY